MSLIRHIFCAIQFQVTSPPSVRDVIRWPFSNVSIWNLPIGNNAAFKYAGISTTAATAIAGNQELMFINTSHPVTNIYYTSAAWSTDSRCNADIPLQVLLSTPFPPNFYIPDSPRHSYPTTFLLSDKTTLRQGQPLAHCDAAHPVTLNWFIDPSTFSESPSIYGPGFYGAHGGSGLSAFGGAIRMGEFIPGADGVVRPVRHALKINIQGSKYFYKSQSTAWNNCYFWPAKQCGGYSNFGGSNPYVGPGSLLALNSSVNIYNLGLTSIAGLAVAWTLQNYGAYIVDDSGWDGAAFAVEYGTSGDYLQQFSKAYGYTFQNGFQNENKWTRDVRTILNKLSVVTNWNAAAYSTVAASKGTLGVGGGAPKQSWAPRFGNPYVPTTSSTASPTSATRAPS
eukprot:gene36774-49588_t